MLTTERLKLERLTTNDDTFILKLVNTPGWLTYIGDKKIHTVQDAQLYIQNIMNNEELSYWVISNKEDGQAIGLISLIKRDYLDHHDLGFAFLPETMNKGYAYEATSNILKTLLKEGLYKSLSAITIPENSSSIKLLGRLGFTFVKSMEAHDEVLNLYHLDLNKEE